MIVGRDWKFLKEASGMYPMFQHDVFVMNHTKDLAPINPSNWVAVNVRLGELAEIFDKHFTELDDISMIVDEADDENWGRESPTRDLPLKIAVKLSYLLADIIVTCSSEAQRWGIPVEQLLMIIMASKTSEKGPKYWRPEPLIEFMLTHPPEDMSNVIFTRDTEGVITYEIRDSGPFAIQPKE